MTTDKDALTTVTLEMIAAGENEFARAYASTTSGFRPSKAFCEMAAIAIYGAMSRARTQTTSKGDE